MKAFWEGVGLLLVVLEMEPGILPMLGKYSMNKLSSQPFMKTLVSYFKWDAKW